MRFFTTLFYIFTASLLFAQGPTKTNVYLFDLSINKERSYDLTNPKFLTQFNQNGYNNQPGFIGNDQLMITVQFPGDSQTDLYKLDLRKWEKTRFTATAESEYSARLMPSTGASSNNQHISCVRVETDGNATQVLWKYPLNQSDDGNRLLSDLTAIGYYDWSSRDKLAAFIVGEPHSLVAVDRRNDEVIKITENIGRCIQHFPNGDIAFVHKTSEDSWLLKRLNMATYEPELVTAMLDGAEDFVILRNGTVIMGKGSKLYKFNRLMDIEWKEIADLAHLGIKNISRMAVNVGEGRMAIVSGE